MDTGSIFDRRMAHEWRLLHELAIRNPGRMSRMQLDGGVIKCHLHGPVASDITRSCLITRHAIRIEFPVHFPAVPMEMFLDTPVFHPNMHPETGFVCLWDRHRVSNTVEHALHKLVAMLSGHLQNTAAMHVMQPEACDHPIRTEAMPLLGVDYDPGPTSDAAVRGQRLRLQ